MVAILNGGDTAGRQPGREYLQRKPPGAKRHRAMKNHLFKKILLLSLMVAAGVPAALFGLGGSAHAETVTIGSGGTAGLYYPLAATLAEILNRSDSDSAAVAEVTDASVENIRLCSRGALSYGMARGDFVYEAYHRGREDDGPLGGIRAVLVFYPSALHVVARGKLGGISVYQLKGKRVAVGARHSGTEYMAERVLKRALGISYASFDAYSYSFRETRKALKDKRVDIGIFCITPPSAFIMDLCDIREMALVRFDEAAIEKITARLPYYSRYRLTPQMYGSLTETVTVPAAWNMLICRADRDPEEVYRLVKTLFEQQASIVRVFPFAETMTPENLVARTVIPLHPGVIRYLAEKGIPLPASPAAE